MMSSDSNPISYSEPLEAMAYQRSAAPREFYDLIVRQPAVPRKRHPSNPA